MPAGPGPARRPRRRRRRRPRRGRACTAASPAGSSARGTRPSSRPCYNAAMRNVVFVAPFPLDTTMRFARAAAGLGDVRLLGILQEPPRGGDAGLFVDLVTVRDGLDARQLIEAARV